MLRSQGFHRKTLLNNSTLRSRRIRPELLAVS
jgi:hypothetical protein